MRDEVRETKKCIFIKSFIHSDKWERHKRLEIGDFVYFISRGNFLNIFKYKGNSKIVSIPDVEPTTGYIIEHIYSKAFLDNKTIQKVVIPGSVKDIMDSAFEGCSNLEEVVLSEGVATIYNRAFRNCVALKRINLPDTLYDVGYAAFAGDEDVIIDFSTNGLDLLRDIFSDSSFVAPYNKQTKAFKNNAKKIDNGLYLGVNLVEVVDYDITSIKIPKMCKYIYPYPFSGCKNLERIEFEDGFDGFFWTSPMGELFSECIREHGFGNLREVITGEIKSYWFAKDVLDLIIEYNLSTSLSEKYIDAIVKYDSEESAKEWLDIYINEAREKEEVVILSKLLEIYHNRFGGTRDLKI